MVTLPTIEKGTSAFTVILIHLSLINLEIKYIIQYNKTNLNIVISD